MADSQAAFDVFLSHNSRDKETVRALVEELKSRGLKVWFDEEQLIPGRPWQDALQEIIKTAKSAAILIGKDGIGPWEAPEMNACIRQFVDRSLPVIPVLLPGVTEPPGLPLFLDGFTWVDLSDGFDSDAIDFLAWGISGSKPDEPSQEDLNSRIGIVLSVDARFYGKGHVWNDRILKSLVESLEVTSPAGFQVLRIDLQMLLPQREAIGLIVDTNERRLVEFGVHAAELSKWYLDEKHLPAIERLDRDYGVSLMCMSDSQAAQTLNITKTLTLIGRHKECDIRLKKRSTSRFHCAILFHGDEFYVSDLRSRIGISCNGQTVEWKRLEHRDELTIGSVSMQFFRQRKSTDDIWGVTDSHADDTKEFSDIIAIQHSMSSDLELDPKHALSFLMQCCGKLERFKPKPYPAREKEPAHNAQLCKVLINEIYNFYRSELGVMIKSALIAHRGQRHSSGGQRDSSDPEPDPEPDVVAWESSDATAPRVSKKVFEHVMRMSQGIKILDVNHALKSDPTFESLAGFGVGASLCAPILDSNTIPRGIIQLDSRTATQFSTSELGLLVAIGAHVMPELESPPDPTLASVVVIEAVLDRRLDLSEAVAFRLHWSELRRQGRVGAVSFDGHRERDKASTLQFSAGRLSDFTDVFGEIFAPFVQNDFIDWEATKESVYRKESMNNTKTKLDIDTYKFYVNSMRVSQTSRDLTDLSFPEAIAGRLKAFADTKISRIEIDDFTRAVTDALYESCSVEFRYDSALGSDEPKNTHPQAPTGDGNEQDAVLSNYHPREFAARLYTIDSIPSSQKRKLLKISQGIGQGAIDAVDPARAIEIINELVEQLRREEIHEEAVSQLISEFSSCCASRVSHLHMIVQATLEHRHGSD